MPLLDDLDWILTLLEPARPVLLAAPLALCRNDGLSSNLMLGQVGTVKLVDFDRAGLNDPMFDVGVLLAGITDFETDMRPMFLVSAGHWDAAAFARARSVCASLDWLKHGEWRLIRARLALRHPQYEEKLCVAGAQP